MSGAETGICCWETEEGGRARFAEEDSLAALDAATKSWNMGRGEWAQASPAHRIAKVQELVAELKPLRDQIINVLMWEICKTKADATKEFDRTMDFIAAAIAELRRDPTVGQGFSQWEVVSGVGVRARVCQTCSC